MDVIFAYIEKLPIIPDNWNLTIAQVLSALLFVGILYAVARVASWFFNKYPQRLLSKVVSQKWANALSEHKFLRP